jgi:antibiotic biosynthesis monooxygenase (ABM) superfamily enzyme
MYSQLLELDLANSLLMLFMFLLNTFVTTYCEFKLVKVIQEKEPLLITKTDPSSFKFQKEYFSKLDEAQKLHQTTAAYKSSRVMLMVILGAFITSVVLNMIFESFSNSVIFLGIILIINLIVHNIYAYEK